MTKLKCWRKVSGTKHTYECKGRWASVTKVKEGYVADTIKDGYIDIIGKAKTKKGAEKIRDDYMKRNDKEKKGMSMEEFIERKNKGEFNT